jgi:hypothetical protein
MQIVLNTIIRVMILSILFHPHRASPVKGEDYSFPSLGGRDQREGEKIAFTFISGIIP